MKKIIFGLLLLFAVTARSFAQVPQETTVTKYWYYPAQNVYYNEVTGNYWYYDEPTTKWMEIKQLPPIYKLSDQDTRYIISYKGPDVWKENKSHKIKYKIKKDGTVKQKGAKSKNK